MSARQRRTLKARVDQRRPILESLISDFSRSARRFDPSQQFGGPSVYFHLKTIEALTRHPAAVDALGDNAFFDYLYATLTSWGLHRMGPSNTKLGDIGELKASFRALASNIERIQELQIDRLDPTSVVDVANKAWEMMANLRVGQTLLVANSKALHHLLPGLGGVPLVVEKQAGAGSR
jgi:hypothetical protein